MIIPTVHIRNATLAYGNTSIFTDISFDLPAGKWIGLLGPSGVGKSSLLRMLAGLIPETKSTPKNFYTDNKIPVSEQIAYMAQTDLLLPWLTVLENATLQIKLRKYNRVDAQQQIDKALALLEKVGLGKATHLYPQQLSGGMRQRVALVRTLLEDKPIVLMDEPFSALDAITRYKLQELAVELLKNKTVLFVTHDPMEALRLAHEIYVMQGSPAKLKPVTVLTSPTPRALTHPDMVAMQALLFQELTHAAGSMS